MARATDPKPANAAELAAYLSTVRIEGANYIRARMEIKPDAGSPATLQIQIKARRSARETAVVYQVLFPKERKGEAVLLRHAGDRAAGGTAFTPPDATHAIDAAGMKDALFGSDLSYEDTVDNFFAWERQTLVGTETVDGVNCQILESRPGKGEWSNYGSVKTWVDPNRLVPMRVEKYASSGQLVRRIDSTRFTKDDKGRVIPASLAVHRPGARRGHGNRGVAQRTRHLVPGRGVHGRWHQA